MNEDKQYPIAEVFTSPQGEGVYCGCMMTFIRLAGCTVGKPIPEKDRGHWKQKFWNFNNGFKIPEYTEVCTLYDSRNFLCDTNYRMSKKLTTRQIFEEVPKGVRHICITGGEPLMHNLNNIAKMACDKGIMVHVETSGTIPLWKALPIEDGIPGLESGCSLWEEDLWVTVSPKHKVLEKVVKRANELKLLVDNDFDPDKIPEFILNHHTVFIQPVNGEFDVDAKNLKLVMEWQKKFPHWRVSLQLHKVLSSYLKELVR